MSDSSKPGNFFKDMLYDGHLSKRGDRPIRARLYAAAIMVLARIGSKRAWGA